MDDWYGWLAQITAMDDWHGWLARMTGMDDWHGWLAWMTGMDDWLSCFKLIFYILITDRQTDRLTLVLVKLLSQLRKVYHRIFKNIFSFRISVTEHCHQATNLVFPRGFSSNMIYNVWTVFGGIMMYKVDKALNLTIVIIIVKLHVQSHQGNSIQELNYH